MAKRRSSTADIPTSAMLTREELAANIIKPDTPNVNQPVDLVKWQGYAIEARQMAEQIVVTDEQSSVLAVDSVKQIKVFALDTEEARTLVVAPFNTFVKRVNAMFKPITETLAQAESTIKSKILAYQQEQERKRIEAERLAREEYERQLAEARKKDEEVDSIFGVDGTQQQAAVAAVPVPTPTLPVTATVGNVGTASTKKIWRWRLMDFSKVPDDLKVVNDQMVTAKMRTMLNNRMTPSVPGIEFYQEESLAIR